MLRNRYFAKISANFWPIAKFDVALNNQCALFFIFNELNHIIFVIIRVKGCGKISCNKQHQNDDATDAIQRIFD